jgi:23S rRNA pseudoU1915 N3-methylase RlmH
MKIIILSVGKPKEKNFSALADKYFRRIGPYVKLGLEFVSEAKDTDPARKVEREGRDILRNTTIYGFSSEGSAFLIALHAENR